VNAGSIFERVYRSIKAELLQGAYRPGDMLEPRSLADRHFASVTPIRDALHRLAGERLVEASPHDGFRVPLMTENTLRDLYGWQESLALLALRTKRAEALVPMMPPVDPVERSRHLFVSLAGLASSHELQTATAQACDHLEPARHLEAQFLVDGDDELTALYRKDVPG
jgi:DNA-binding transcriptional MocR family regulator